MNIFEFIHYTLALFEGSHESLNYIAQNNQDVEYEEDDEY